MNFELDAEEIRKGTQRIAHAEKRRIKLKEMLEGFFDCVMKPLVMLGGFLLLGFAVKSCLESDKYYESMLQQCLKDGHKNYECHAMMRENRVIPMPIVIPVR